jgi:cell division protein FtsN
MLAKKPKGATVKRKTSSVSGLLWMFVGAILTLMIGLFIYLSPFFDFSPTGSTSVSDPNRQVEPRVDTDTDNSDYEFYDILPNQEMATIPDEDIGEAGNDQLGDISDFEPDAVVTQPENSVSNDDIGNVGVADGTVLEPSRGTSNNGAAANDDNDITIIEENTTYDGTTPASSNSGNNSNSSSSNSSSGNSSTSKNNGAQSRPSNANAGTASVQRAGPATTYILQINSFGNADEADRRRAQVLMAGVDARVVKNMTGNDLPIYQVISRPMNNRQAVANAQQRLQNNGIDSIIVEQRS